MLTHLRGENHADKGDSKRMLDEDEEEC